MAFGKPTKGDCARCGSNTWLQNKSKRLCKRCAYLVNKEAKEKRRQGAEELPVSQKKLFLSIYEENKDNWVSEVSGTPLPPKPGPRSTPFQEGLFYRCFAHLVRKGKYPELKLRRDNIALLLPDEHAIYDDQTWKIEERDTGRVLDQRWAAILKRRDQLLDSTRDSPLGR